mmetsp:Transcript_35970/g.32357  ORF Transcript_35970/g.32357 Transcript_35970/m.32357 type:complete len:81 (+) Transcript_35970:150-392(+)
MRTTEKHQYDGITDADGNPFHPDHLVKEGQTGFVQYQMDYKDYYLNEDKEFDFIPSNVEKVALKRELEAQKKFNQKKLLA